MRVLVDGKSHPFLGGTPVNVLAVLAEVDEVLEHQERGVRQLTINGEAWSLERLDSELQHLSIEDVDTLEIKSVPIRDLIDESLSEVAGVIDELPSACHSLATLLNGPDREAALFGYEDIVNVWEELFERHRAALDAMKTKASHVMIEGMALDAWQIRARKLVERGAELASAGEAVDLADLLTYELMPFAEQEAEVIKQLRERSGRRSAKSAE